MTTLSFDLTERVLSAVDSQRDELVNAISQAVQIPSVNPRYPGQVYEEIVGGEGEVSRFVADIYRELGAEVDVFGLEGERVNAVGLISGSGGGR